MQKKKENKILILPVKKRVEPPDSGIIGGLFKLDIFGDLVFALEYLKRGDFPFWLGIIDESDNSYESLPLRVERCRTGIVLFCLFPPRLNMPTNSFRLFSYEMPEHIREPFLAAWEWEEENGLKSIFDMESDMNNLRPSKEEIERQEELKELEARFKELAGKNYDEYRAGKP